MSVLEIGQLAPNFTLPASNGENISLSDFRGQNVVLYFYPKDNTPGCTKESCAFRDYHSQFNEQNTVILGVSLDGLPAHDKFIQKLQLPFLLLSDTDAVTSTAYEVYKMKKNFGKEYMGIERSTFVIDKEGKLVKAYRKVKVDGHVEAVLANIVEQLG